MVLLLPLIPFGLVALVNAAAAPEVRDSPTNVMYQANFNASVTGSVMFSSTNGSVLVAVNLNRLPQTGGPFRYQIHERPVPQNGSCTDTLGVLNPYDGTANTRNAAEMEVGNLSGKHGPINGTSASLSYIDQYLSLGMRDRAFVGDLSLVVDYANNTRFACANITMMRFLQTRSRGAAFKKTWREHPIN